MIQLDEHYPLPLYYQLKEDIIKKIKEGHYHVKSSLPSEKLLMEIYGVSRTTVRQAVDILVNDGYLERRRGLGTFVTNPEINMWELEKLRSFKDETQRQGLKSKTELMNICKVPKDNELQTVFKDTYETFYKLERLRYVNDTPSIYVITYIPCDLVPRLEEEDLSQNSLFALFENKYEIAIGYAEKTIKAINANKVEANILKLQEHSAIQLVHTITYDKYNVPIELSISKDRGDVSQFKVRLQYK